MSVHFKDDAVTRVKEFPVRLKFSRHLKRSQIDSTDPDLLIPIATARQSNQSQSNQQKYVCQFPFSGASKSNLPSYDSLQCVYV